VCERHEDVLSEPEGEQIRAGTAAHSEEDDIGSAVIAEFADWLQIWMNIDLLPQQPTKPGQRGREEARCTGTPLRIGRSLRVPMAGHGTGARATFRR
jgi:hypothetical protein